MTEAWEPRVEAGPVRPEPKGFPVGLTVATVIVFVILIGLGVWQLQRLKWKEALLAGIARAEASPAQPLAPVLDGLAAGRDAEFRRVTVTCPGLAGAPALELYSLREGQIGYRLISACQLADGPYRAILVDRGFIPDTVSARPPADAANHDPVALTGVLRKGDRGNFMTPPNTPQRWYLHDAKAMAAALRAPPPVAPLFLMAETSANPDFKALIPAPFPVDIPNRHLEYALTWFGLAGALAGVYGAAVFKRMRG
ncbi:SURF1 family protein [Phenylobacterium sp.]|uniref:SURF1 family protein n=1 Tax=Phenylobacterium sp. TaxID=1871053 RepID=UPI0011F4983C|nr:SURF1 family cytochrome oxidase biogenesis protein [Phenylobacterium sp.]THD58815.1 MAG: SURF1 family protein [Phenylobacterium sp.]